MKKISFLLIFAIAVMLLFGSDAYCQAAPLMNKEKLNKSVIISSNTDNLALENIKAVNAKMYRDFSKKFKDASDIQVDVINKKTMITCLKDGKKSRVVYTKRGICQHIVSTYGNEQLPEHIRNQIEFAYPRYSIFGTVIEVTANNKTAHLVTIEDKTSWKRVRVVDGEMDVYEEYEKR